MNTSVSDSPFCCSDGDAEAVVQSVSFFYSDIYVKSFKDHSLHDETRDDKNNNVFYNWLIDTHIFLMTFKVNKHQLMIQ